MTNALKRAVRPVALGVSLAWGQLTCSMRLLPEFLIVGAQRCGTTSMFRALVQHPAVLRPPFRKGVHYFDTGYYHGEKWYRAHFPTKALAGLVQRHTGVTPRTFESSPYYMFHPLAGERIAHDLPGVRLVVLLRDPVERAYSAHAHEFARGFETVDFAEAIELEPERLAGEEARLRSEPTAYSHSHQHHAYATRGQYVTYLSRLASLVGRERIHVVDSQDFFEDPQPAYEQVLKFLHIPVLGKMPTFDRHNARPRSPMAESIRRRLDEHFAPYDEQLVSWLGETPSWRR